MGQLIRGSVVQWFDAKTSKPSERGVPYRHKTAYYVLVTVLRPELSAKPHVRSATWNVPTDGTPPRWCGTGDNYWRGGEVTHWAYMPDPVE